MRITPLLVTLACLCAPAFAAGINDATAEHTGPNAFKITFTPSTDAGDVAIYASSSATGFGNARPLVEKATSPVTVTTPDSGRVYFHLKPKSGPVRVVATRALDLEGGINFRDLGGYKTEDGKHVKWGMVFRSAKLDKLTPKDYTLLNSLGVKLVCDFRMPSEVGVAVTNWSGDTPPTLWSNPIDTPRGPRARPAPPPPTGPPPSGLASTYRWMAIEGLPEFAALMKRIAGGDTPTLFHCQEGRGRTGLFAALLLRALGVPEPEVTKDFMLTNEYLLTDDALNRMRNAAGGGGNETIEQMRTRLRISEDMIAASFAAIAETYPSYDDFLTKGLKMTPAEVTSLRTRLLEP